MIRISGSFRYDDNWLFRDIDLALQPVGWTCLLGPSGVGKSTLLRLLIGLETRGWFDGKIETDDGIALTGRAAYMAQSDLLMPWLDVLGNVTLGAQLRGETSDKGRAHALIERVGLKQHINKYPAELSGGMRQRVALARTLMEDSPVVVLDEPFSALDARTRIEMQDLAFELLNKRTVLLVTHDPGEAARLGHKIAILDEAGLRDFPVTGTGPLRPFDDLFTQNLQIKLLSTLRSVRS